MRTIHVVSHTHWDREWYHPAERFRVRLVNLIDELLDGRSDGTSSFLLDGQAVVLEDYLEVRPENADRLAKALQTGALEAGPWFVLPDELIPGGEGLVRNLLAGRRALRALGANPSDVLYCPDSFGHPATLPALAAGFDKRMIILWRGFGSARIRGTNALSWLAPGGERAFVYPLSRSGYELGSSLPTDAAGAQRRWSGIDAEWAGRDTVPLELLLNGADHHALQADLPAAIERLAAAASGDRVQRTSLSAFARQFLAACERTELPVVAGELRDSYGFTWTLQGTLASRAPQKRRYVQQERALVRDVEPWLALAWWRGGATTGHFARAAWRSLLLCQPHDTLCGCSIDQVARAMDARIEATATQADELRQVAIERIIGHDRDAARQRPDEWRPVLLVRNRAPRVRSGVALVEITAKLADVPVGPGSPRRTVRQPVANALPANLEVTHERTESPRAYPDNDAVARFFTAVWLENVPAYGVTTMSLGDDAALARTPSHPVTANRRSMTNGRLTVRWDGTGRLTLEDHQAGRRISDLLTWESREDQGDLYTPSIRGPRLRTKLISTHLLANGPLTAIVEQHWRLTRGRAAVDARVRVALDAAAPFVRFAVLGDNAATDHRLRLVIGTGVRPGSVHADAAFGPLERRPVRVTRADRRMETPPGTDPLHRYVSLFDARQGASVFSDGLCEYQVTGGRVFVTLVRAVGELSRNDLPERPGHAGWPEATPQAQCIGPFEAEFALLLHGARSPDVIDEIERTADDVLVPLTGTTLRSALASPGTITGVELRGQGLSLACIKQSDDDAWLVLRCVNLLDTQASGAWRVPTPVREARSSRLDETPLAPLPVHGMEIPFVVPGRGILTILVR